MKFSFKGMKILPKISVPGLSALLLGTVLLWKDWSRLPSSNEAITFQQALAMRDRVVWVDARSIASFKQRHIETALNINGDNWDAALPNLFRNFVPGKIIIVYCTPGCMESRLIAQRIRDAGFEPVLFLSDGFSEDSL